jgi:hypothetical protein
MKTFVSWAEENRIELPAISESKMRGGTAWWAYPDAYARSQYPTNYFTPRAADAPFKLGIGYPNKTKG